MFCYKCGSEKELSIRRANRRKDGTVRSVSYICRPCRREEARNRRKNGKLRTTPLQTAKKLTWEEQSQLSQNRILQRS